MRSISGSERRSAALFGSLDYAITGNLNLHSELRFTRERVEDDCLTPSCGPSADAAYFNFVTPRVSLDAHLATASLLWLSAAKGARSGGANANTNIDTHGTDF